MDFSNFNKIFGKTPVTPEQQILIDEINKITKGHKREPLIAFSNAAKKNTSS